jgi:phage terminase Nu1 subunit (DNA packaging protein)
MPTQTEIAAHLFMDERSVREALPKIAAMTNQDSTVDKWWQDASMDVIRRGFILHQREMAAGRGGDQQSGLTAARTSEALANTELKMLMIKEKAGDLVSMAEVEPQLMAMVTAARQELLALPDKLANELKALHDYDVDAAIIEDHIHAALIHLSTSLHGVNAGDDAAGAEGMGAAA